MVLDMCYENVSAAVKSIACSELIGAEEGELRHHTIRLRSGMWLT